MWGWPCIGRPDVYGGVGGGQPHVDRADISSQERDLLRPPRNPLWALGFQPTLLQKCKPALGMWSHWVCGGLLWMPQEICLILGSGEQPACSLCLKDLAFPGLPVLLWQACLKLLLSSVFISWLLLPPQRQLCVSVDINNVYRLWHFVLGGKTWTIPFPRVVKVILFFCVPIDKRKSWPEDSS